MASTADYPDALDTAGALRTVGYIRSGTLKDRKNLQDAGKVEWHVQGFLQRRFLGVPGEEPKFASAADAVAAELSDADRQTLAELGEAILPIMEVPPQTREFSNSVEGMSLALLLQGFYKLYSILSALKII